MAIEEPAPGSVGSPVERLRSLADADVTLTTADGEVTGTVLSCTRTSVWLVSDDTDVVVSVDRIIAVARRPTAPAA